MVRGPLLTAGGAISGQDPSAVTVKGAVCSIENVST